MGSSATPTAVIVDAVRTASGRRSGVLSGWHPADLAGEVLTALVTRNGLDPALIDDVIMGCVTQVGNQSLNVARSAVLAAGFPESVPATTIDRQCGSSQQAVHFAAQGVMAGAYDIVIAGGVEVMSTTPMGASVTPGSQPFGPRVLARYAETGLKPQGLASELVAEQWGLTRHALDEYAARSQHLAAQATDEGRFEREIVPVATKRQPLSGRKQNGTTGLVTRDEGLRPDTTVEVLAALPPAFLHADGRMTAGNSSQIADGASATLIMSEEAARRLGLVPRARFTKFALAGVDPVTMLTGPILATTKILARCGLSIGDIDHFEVNEAFASVVLAWVHEHRPDQEKVNPNGGAIALGHPLGASGTRLLATMLCELERTGGRFGLQTMCEGGGMANAMVIERMG